MKQFLTDKEKQDIRKAKRRVKSVLDSLKSRGVKPTSAYDYAIGKLAVDALVSLDQLDHLITRAENKTKLGAG